MLGQFYVGRLTNTNITIKNGKIANNLLAFFLYSKTAFPISRSKSHVLILCTCASTSPPPYPVLLLLFIFMLKPYIF